MNWAPGTREEAVRALLIDLVVGRFLQRLLLQCNVARGCLLAVLIPSIARIPIARATQSKATSVAIAVLGACRDDCVASQSQRSCKILPIGEIFCLSY